MMMTLQTDLSVFHKFNFKKAPVGVKFLFKEPSGIKQLNKELALCEMLKETQDRNESFYISKENENCAGKFVLGMTKPIAPPGLMAHIGVKLGIFQEARANRRIHEINPTFPEGLVNYVVFSPLNKLEFEPDLLFITADPSQAEIILRANTYSTGELLETKHSIVGACQWLFIYPFKSGKINYILTGLSFGMKAKHVYPEGLVLISIPYDKIPIIVNNLKEMTWELPAYKKGREWIVSEWKRITDEFSKECRL